MTIFTKGTPCEFSGVVTLVPGNTGTVPPGCTSASVWQRDRRAAAGLTDSDNLRNCVLKANETRGSSRTIGFVEEAE